VGQLLPKKSMLLRLFWRRAKKKTKDVPKYQNRHILHLFRRKNMGFFWQVAPRFSEKSQIFVYSFTFLVTFFVTIANAVIYLFIYST